MSTNHRQQANQLHARVLESELYEPVANLSLFQAEMVCMAREVAFGRKRVDLVGVNSRGDLIAVEFKVRDWRRVLWQAAVNQLFADFSYVAVWHTALRFFDREHLREKGIGLISISEGGARTIRRAARSAIRSSTHREGVLQQLRPRPDERAAASEAAS